MFTRFIAGPSPTLMWNWAEATPASMRSCAPSRPRHRPFVGGSRSSPRRFRLHSSIDPAEFEGFLPAFGWRPLEQGVRETVEAYREAHRLELVNAERILTDGAPRPREPPMRPEDRPSSRGSCLWYPVG